MVLRSTECHECGSPTGAHNVGCQIGHVEANREVARLQGTLRYIAAQAKAGHAGALQVIAANAEGALDGSTAKMQRAAFASDLRREPSHLRGK